MGRNLDKRCLVSTLLLLFAFSNLLEIFTYGGIGILSPQSTLIVLAMSPITILSSNFGNFLNKKVRPELFRNIVLLIILVAGISLIIFLVFDSPLLMRSMDHLSFGHPAAKGEIGGFC
ncbi:MAG: TSUP family transporter [Desulfobaccales bacterium]